MMGLFQDLVAIQRETNHAFADRIGAVHALTFGHSKAVLSVCLTGSTARCREGLAVCDAARCHLQPKSAT
jgi:ABC-type nickel/cobalt efflux system permease component RcnA